MNSLNEAHRKREYGIVILNRYPEFARNFIRSIKRTHESLPHILVVRDRNSEDYGTDAFTIDAPEPFVYARNSNLGIRFFDGIDVFLCNDDLECLETNFFEKVYSTACKWPKCGLISPLIAGGVGNRYQSYHSKKECWENYGLPDEVVIQDMVVCFPCVLLRRPMIEQVGLLDENFTGYGLDDDDYCIRARKAGWWTMITRKYHIKHGNGGPGINRGYNYSLSFAREPEKASPMEYFNSKHSVVPAAK